jgi:hypothetical protein
MHRPRFARHRVLSHAAACTLAVVLAGCSIPGPNDAEIGCAYDPQSSPLCPGYDAGASSTDAASPASRSDAGSADSAPPDASPDGAQGGGASGLGSACNAPTDCSGFEADYCLVSPTGGFPSFCTFTHCTESVCGSSYACCDCTASPIAQISAFPPGVCVLPMTAAALPSYGCTCMPQAQ